MTPREIDALVAEKVMGYETDWWSIHVDEKTGHGCLKRDAKGDIPILEMLVDGEWEPIPHYTESIVNAWLVVEKVQENVFDFQLERRYCLANMWWKATFTDIDGRKYESFEPTAPMAICKAALLAMGVNIK